MNGEPAMCLAPLVPRQQKNAFVICLSAAHKYTEPEYMLVACMKITELFDLGVSLQRLARMAAFIEDGFDDLVHMKPMCAVYDDKPKVIGEGDLFVDGSKECSFEVTD